MKSWVLAFILSLSCVSAIADGIGQPERLPPNAKPKELEGVGITEKLATQIDLGLQFEDENGQTIQLSKYINGNRPVLLGLVYYGCPNLCNFFMNGVTDVLKDVAWNPGNEFDVVFVSIDPEEGSELASKKKENMLTAYGRVQTRDGWHFLTGNEANIKALAAQVGFGYRWDDKSQQWAHAAAAIITTPTGTISRYLYGIMFEPQTLKLSLLEAGKNKIGGIVDKILLFCYKFDPSRGKYSIYAMNVMRAAAVLTLLILGFFFYPYWRKTRLINGDSNL
jgi:protein SCO1